MNEIGRISWKRRFGAEGITMLLLGIVILHGQSDGRKQPYAAWSDFGGTMDSMQYSSLQQITKSNVNKLELAWSYLAPGSRPKK